MSRDFLIYALLVLGCLILAVPILGIAKELWFRQKIRALLNVQSDDKRQSSFKSFPALKSTTDFVADKAILLRTDVLRLIAIDQSVHRVGFIVLSGCGTGFLIGFVLTRSIFICLFMGLALSLFAFLFYRQIRFQTYSDLISKSFPNAIDGLIRCLRAGFDLSKSLTIVSTELPKELQIEFRFMLRNRNLGQSIGDAMYFMASRLGSREAFFLATLISVQERTGGPLVDALESLSHILKERERLRQKRLVASAEARMSALILGGLPVAIAILLFATNPTYRDVLLETQSGRSALIFGLCLLSIGSFVMYRLIRMPST